MKQKGHILDITNIVYCFKVINLFKLLKTKDSASHTSLFLHISDFSTPQKCSHIIGMSSNICLSLSLTFLLLQSFLSQLYIHSSILVPILIHNLMKSVRRLPLILSSFESCCPSLSFTLKVPCFLFHIPYFLLSHSTSLQFGPHKNKNKVRGITRPLGTQDRRMCGSSSNFWLLLCHWYNCTDAATAVLFLCPSFPHH